MKMSRRARRMERYHKWARSPALNLVSLMDIFTILVFFLLVNSSNIQQLPSSKDIRLPASLTQNPPEETLVIAITQADILVQGRPIVALSDVMADGQGVIAELEEELLFQAGKSQLSGTENEGRKVTIMGDENTAYGVLSRILSTCRKANYTQIAFAAVQHAKSPG